MEMFGKTTETDWNWNCGGEFVRTPLPSIPFAQFKRELKKRHPNESFSSKRLRAAYNEVFDSIVFSNEKYQVNVMGLQDTPLGPCMHLSIKSHDKEPIHDWRDLQAIKNRFTGEEGEAIEIYPAMSRLMDTANQYHLWCFPPGVQVPFGLFDVHSVSETVGGTAKQRPFHQS